MRELAIPETVQIIPWRASDLQRTGQNLAQALLSVAELTLEQDSPDFRRDYNGAEQQAMISERALKLHNLMELAMDVAGQELVESLKKNGSYHPDLRSDSQELVDELISKGDQWKRRQGHYIVNTVFPRAKELGVNLEAWKEQTSYVKLRELCPDFRFVLEDSEIDEEERNELLLSLVALSTKRLTEIRTARMLDMPSEFRIYERPRGEGFEWHVPYITGNTRDWLLRKAQPYGKMEKEHETGN